MKRIDKVMSFPTRVHAATWLEEHGVPPNARVVRLHKDWCLQFKHNFCTCEPSVELRPVQAPGRRAGQPA